MSTTITIAETMPAAAGGVAPASVEPTLAEQATWLPRAASRRGQVAARPPNHRPLPGPWPGRTRTQRVHRMEGLVAVDVSGAWLAR